MSIARADWPRLLGLLEQAMEQPAEQRAAWLQALDLPAPLKDSLRELLAQRREIETADFLGGLPAIAPPAAHGRLHPGAMIGPWRLLREIGQGGMSSVWLAERADQQLTRQVALKLPHAGPGQDLLAARLLRERDILAGLEHRNIARLYDVGLTGSGTPYLVMEYVAGDTLLAHATRQRLDIPQRIALFQQVLRAVQYAHGQLVLHRDLKPGNILVNEAGDVKLLDFGIARQLDDGSPADSPLTQHSGHLLTPDYAAPEQIAGQPLGTACDVYALGVVLFELLTGKRPFALPAGGRRAALEDAIAHQPPPRPSDTWRGARDAGPWRATPAALRRALSGDLDLIVLTALRKTPAERYPSADAFAQDLQRHLQREPILARPASRWYRLHRFASRHRVGVAAGSAVLLALSAGLGVAMWQGRQARLEADKATAIKDFVVGLLRHNDLEQADALARRQQTLEQVLRHSAKALDTGLREQPEVRSELQALVGGLLFDLELLADALPLQQQHARELAVRQAPAVQQVRALRALADSQQGQLDDAARSLDTALQLCRWPHQPLSVDCADVAIERGRVALAHNQIDAAPQWIEPATTALQTLAPDSAQAANALRSLGELRDDQGRFAEAEALMQQSLALVGRLWGPGSARLAHERRLWALRLGLRQRLALAAAEHRQAWQAMVAALGPSSVRTARFELELGLALWRIGIDPEAGQHLTHAAQMLQDSEGPDRPRLVFLARLAMAEWRLYDGQLQRSLRSLAALRESQVEFPPSGDDARNADILQARLLTDTGRFAEARAVLLQRQGLLRQQFGPDDVQAADLDRRLIEVDIAAGQPDQAEATLARLQGLVHGEAAERLAPVVDAARGVLALARGRHEQALPWAKARLDAMQARPRDDQYRVRVVDALDLMGQVQRGLGRPAQARGHFEQALAELQRGYAHNPALAALRARYAACLLDLGERALARQQLALAQAALRAEPGAGPQFRRDLDAVVARLGR